MLKKLLYVTLSTSLIILCCVSCGKDKEEITTVVQFSDADFGQIVAEAFSKNVSELTEQDLLNVEGVDVRYFSKLSSDNSSYVNVWNVSIMKKGYHSVYDKYFSVTAEERDGLEKPSDYRYSKEVDVFEGYDDLDKFTAMTELNLSSDYYIIKINPMPYIASLNSLKNLSIYNFTIPDLSVASLFTNLDTLSIGLNPRNLEPEDKIEFINDVTPLKNLKNLETLALSGTNISDLSPLVSLKNLKNLSCTMCSLSDISPVANMTSLESVDFYYNAIENVEPLSALPELKYIRLDYNYISDVTPFSKLNPEKIEYVTLEMNAIEDTSPMRHLGENKVYVGYDLYWEQ